MLRSPLNPDFPKKTPDLGSAHSRCLTMCKLFALCVLTSLFQISLGEHCGNGTSLQDRGGQGGGLVSMVIPSFLCLSRTRQRHMKADQPSGDPGGSQQLCLREMELLESDLHCY